MCKPKYLFRILPVLLMTACSSFRSASPAALQTASAPAVKFDPPGDTAAPTRTRWPTRPIPGTAAQVAPAALDPGTQPHPTLVPCGKPAGWVTYVIAAGDTLYHLSVSYGISVSDLQLANCLSGSLIRTGQRLYVPPWPAVADTPALANPPVVNETITLAPTESNPETTKPQEDDPPAQTEEAPTIPTATGAYNQTGSYTFTDRCVSFTLENSAVTINMCVMSVDVRENGEMQFNIRWLVSIPGPSYLNIVKRSDLGNPNMNVTDNLGNRYDHIELGGAAGTDTTFRNGQLGTGWYLFPPAQPGATAFTFHDDDQHVSIEDIVLIK